jgi:hypothetical protein
MIDELDEIQIIIESEDSDDDCKITNSTEPSTQMSKREILYNLKKEITIKGIAKKDEGDKKTAWRTLIVKS